MKKSTEAVLSIISKDNQLLIISTSGTKAAPGSKFRSWSITWGDGSSSAGINNPPNEFEHYYHIKGNYNVTFIVKDTKDGSDSDMMVITIGATPVPPIVIAPGPIQAACPVGAILIPAGSTSASRQALINANPSGSSFCIEAGSHTALSSNVPKVGNIFTGQFGSVIDGTGWATGDDNAALFVAPVANVIIRNLTMLNLPQRGVSAYPWDAAIGWTIDHCEIGFVAGEGVIPGNNNILTYNKIHDCRRVGHPVLGGSAVFAGGAYPNVVDNVLIENNEFYEFGATQKLLDATNIVWRNNTIYNGDGPAVWNDGVGDGFLAEGNTITACNVGVMVELSRFGTVRNNSIVNCADQAVFITTSRDIEIYGNIISGNFRAIAYFVNCVSVGSFPWDPDLRNNYAHHNTITVPATPGAFANFLSYSGTCSAGAEIPYVTNTKNNNFNFNTYLVPDVNGFYWLYGGGLMQFPAWQSLPQDVNGSVS